MPVGWILLGVRFFPYGPPEDIQGTPRDGRQGGRSVCVTVLVAVADHLFIMAPSIVLVLFLAARVNSKQDHRAWSEWDWIGFDLHMG